MKIIKIYICLYLISAGACLHAPADIVFDMTTIGNPGNPDDAPYPDPLGNKGAVDYIYQISTYEVTVAQYTAFLNAKAASDPHALYDAYMADDIGAGGATILRSGIEGSYTYTVVAGKENQPVRYVNFYDGLRLANWLHNGQDDGDTETGAYNLSLGVYVDREAGARWALVSDDEWHKAAHYDPDTGTYFEYPNGKNAIDYPTDQTTPREQNFGDIPFWQGSVFFTSRGETTGQSAYGVCDMGGNVWEWTDTRSKGDIHYRVVRGGSYSTSADYLSRDGGVTDEDTIATGAKGFRLVFLDIIPEPASCLLMLLGGVALLFRRKKKWRANLR
jgi:formylglycine-generating enzyme required for sulfatase activity